MEPTLFLDGKVALHRGDCRDVVASLPDGSVDSVVTDPPYSLVSIVKRFGKEGSAPAKSDGASGVYKRASAGFMGKQWDTGEVAFDPEFWSQVLRVLKPGGHLAAFSGTRTYHRMACAIEDAGFEVRDQLAWAYGSGFPKSLDVSKAIDKDAGHWRGRAGAVTIAEQTSKGTEYERTDKGEPITASALQWQGWGTALKPAWEPICLARKPLIGTVAANVLAHGTGALNIDSCRIGTDGGTKTGPATRRNTTVHAYGDGLGAQGGEIERVEGLGRWPANLLHDGSDEVLAGFPETAPSKSGMRGNQHSGRHGGLADIGGNIKDGTNSLRGMDDDGGSAARFFASFPQDKSLWNQEHASFAASSLSLSSAAAVSALCHAVEASTRGLVLSGQSYRAPSTTVTGTELRRLSDAVITLILSIGERCSLASPPEKHTLTNGLASIAAIPRPTGIIGITINLLKLNGSAEPVTFDIIETSAEAGASDSARKRLHYTAKADADDRVGSKHPTVKPVDLMRWLCRLITPPGGTILDPFSGTGTTGEAAFYEGFKAILVEREPEYQADIERRMKLCLSGPDERKRESIKAKLADKPIDAGPLFGDAA